MAVPTHHPVRDRARELAFLREIDPTGDYTRRVIARLDRSGRDLGRDVPAHLTIGEVLAEAREECEDLAGWPLMALHLADQRLPADVAARARRTLLTVARLAAIADAELAALIEDIEQA
jgi:hypothetical protein